MHVTDCCPALPPAAARVLAAAAPAQMQTCPPPVTCPAVPLPAHCCCATVPPVRTRLCCCPRDWRCGRPAAACVPAGQLRGWTAAVPPQSGWPLGPSVAALGPPTAPPAPAMQSQIRRLVHLTSF
eukprot:scaffold61794_cov19-Tisochrysis_lutea.AAC.1